MDRLYRWIIPDNIAPNAVDRAWIALDKLSLWEEVPDARTQME